MAYNQNACLYTATGELICLKQQPRLPMCQTHLQALVDMNNKTTETFENNVVTQIQQSALQQIQQAQKQSQEVQKQLQELQKTKMVQQIKS